jgi:hypothetical protein
MDSRFHCVHAPLDKRLVRRRRRVTCLGVLKVLNSSIEEIAVDKAFDAVNLELFLGLSTFSQFLVA